MPRVRVLGRVWVGLRGSLAVSSLPVEGVSSRAAAEGAAAVRVHDGGDGAAEAWEETVVAIVDAHGSLFASEPRTLVRRLLQSGKRVMFPAQKSCCR